MIDFIQGLPGGKGFTSYLPSELTKPFSEVGLDHFVMVIDDKPSVTYVGLGIGTLEPWTVIDDVLILEGMSLTIDIVEPAGRHLDDGRCRSACQVPPEGFHRRFRLQVVLQKSQAKWEIERITGAYYGAVTLGDIVAGLLSSGASVPEALYHIAFSNFGVNAVRSTPGTPFTYTIYGSASVAFPIADQQLAAELALIITRTRPAMRSIWRARW